MNPALCSHCGQALPSTEGRLTPRELDVLACWWLTGSVKAAASLAGVGEQRAKNMLARARIRNRADSNAALLAMHFADARAAAVRRMQHNLAGGQSDADSVA